MTEDSSQSSENPLGEEVPPREFLILGHFIKYNIYLLAKATVFSAIYANLKSTRDALAETRAVMKDFDEPPKMKKKLKKG